MAKQELPPKMFYSITEVAQHYGINESTLRFWEKEFDIIAPKRSDNQRKIRSYTPQDVHNIGLIYHLLKEQRLTLSGAKERLKRKNGETQMRYEVLSRLQAIRAELVAIRRELDQPRVTDRAPSATPSGDTPPDAPQPGSKPEGEATLFDE